MSDLIPSAVICAGTVFLLVAGENVARWIRVASAATDAQPKGEN